MLKNWIPVTRFCWRESCSQLCPFFAWPSASLGLLEVCMMTHRAPLSPPSTTHEPWPLIPHMWVWDAVTTATAVSTEAFARCPWIVGVSSFESVCRCIMTTVVGGCERKRAVDASPCAVACIYLKTGCMVWSLLGQKGLCLGEKNLCRPSFLMLPLRTTPPPPPCFTCT